MRTIAGAVAARLTEAGLAVGRSGDVEVTYFEGRARVILERGRADTLDYAADVLRIHGFEVTPGQWDWYLVASLPGGRT